MTNATDKKNDLTEDQIERIKNSILASIYEDIGRSVVRKVLWTLGAVLFVFLSWAGYSGHVKII